MHCCHDILCGVSDLWMHYEPIAHLTVDCAVCVFDNIFCSCCIIAYLLLKMYNQSPIFLLIHLRSYCFALYYNILECGTLIIET